MPIADHVRKPDRSRMASILGGEYNENCLIDF